MKLTHFKCLYYQRKRKFQLISMKKEILSWLVGCIIQDDVLAGVAVLVGKSPSDIQFTSVQFISFKFSAYN